MSINYFKIKNKYIGTDYPTFIIAEIAQSHDGSLGMAHSFIDAASEVGVDAIKFQTHIATSESTFDEPFRVRTPSTGQSLALAAIFKGCTP